MAISHELLVPADVTVEFDIPSIGPAAAGQNSGRQVRLSLPFGCSSGVARLHMTGPFGGLGKAALRALTPAGNEWAGLQTDEGAFANCCLAVFPPSLFSPSPPSPP